MKKWCVSLTMLAFSIMGTLAMADELKIEVMQEGDGDVAENGQRVTVHYEGRLTDDTVFDASKPRGQPFSFTIGAGQVIQGWEQGVAGMKVGEMRRLIIPANLGYGVAGAGGVSRCAGGPNAGRPQTPQQRGRSPGRPAGRASPSPPLGADGRGWSHDRRTGPRNSQPAVHRWTECSVVA